MKRNLQNLLLLGVLFFTLSGRAQIAGPYTIPGSFPSIAAAITTLNIAGVAGPVTLNIAAGYTENAPAGGYKLFSPPGSSATNSVVFQKSGAGPNPRITAYTGTATPISAIQDGVFWLIGSDYITIDGLDIIDPNTTNPATMEFGYGFYRVSATNGCQYNTIKNCTVTLNKINGTSANSTFIANGSRGIETSSAHYQANTSYVTPTSPAGENSYNKFYGNTIQNCNDGIALMAYSNPGFIYLDRKNEIGTTVAGTGNTIINFGGATTGYQANGITTNGQTSLTISGNYINNNTGAGASPQTGLTGIEIAQTVFGIYTVSNNTLTLSSASGIAPWGIYNTTNASTLTVRNNVFTGNSAPNSNIGATSHSIWSPGPGGVVSVATNTIENTTVATGTMGCITARADTVKITGNIIRNISGGSARMVIIESYGVRQNISNNFIDNITYANTATYYAELFGIQSDNGLDLSISSNTLTNLRGNIMTGIDVPTQSYNGKALISGNVVSNISGQPGSNYGISFFGISHHDSPSFSTTTVSVVSNTISSVTSAGTGTLNNSGGICAISVFNGSGTYSNTIASIGRNKIYGIATSGTSGVTGIQAYNITPTIYNNLVGDIAVPKSNTGLAIVGITLQEAKNANVHYNTIYLTNSLTTSTLSGSTVLYANNSTYAIKNNIFVNMSATAGTGRSCVMMDASSLNPLTGYNTASGNNLFFAGTPAANRILYTSSAGSYSTLAQFKIFIAPREVQSVTENPPFITTNGSLADYLSIDPAISSQIEGGALPVPGITIDYAGTARHATTPDIGAWEGAFTKAVRPVIVSSGFTSSACNLAGRTMTANISSSSGVGTGVNAPRLYFRVNFAPSYSSVQGILSSGTNTNGVWTFNMNYSAAVSDVIRYFVAMQEQRGITDVVLVPANGGAADDVNTITIPPNPASSYTIQTAPTISAANATVCAGQNYTINPTGASTYSYSGGSAVVSPATNTTYVISGFSSGGCASTNTVTINITVLASPVISVNSGTICAGEIFVLSPSGAGTYSFSSTTATVTPSSTSYYYVSSGNALGCITTVISTVVVNPLPPLTAVANEYTVCEGQSTVLHANGANTFSWEPIGSSAAHVTVTPVATTAYTVTGTNATGCKTTSVLTVAVTTCVVGVAKPEANETLFVYPNPSNGKITVRKYSSGESYSLKVYALTGELVYTGILKGEENTLDLHELNRGLYFIQFYSNGILLKQEKFILN